jgi:hypothetical protein
MEKYINTSLTGWPSGSPGRRALRDLPGHSHFAEIGSRGGRTNFQTLRYERSIVLASCRRAASARLRGALRRGQYEVTKADDPMMQRVDRAGLIAKAQALLQLDQAPAGDDQVSGEGQ